MRSHAQIVRDAGTAEALATKHNVAIHTVRSWIQRNSIPGDQWARMAGDDRDLLAELANSAEQKALPPAPEQAAA